MYYCWFSFASKAEVQNTGCSASMGTAHPSYTLFRKPLISSCGKGKLEPTAMPSREGMEKGGEMVFQHWLGLVQHIQPHREWGN